MKKAVTMMGLTLLLTLMTATAFAGPGMWGGRFYGMGPMLSNLTPEQSAKILALQQAHYEKIAPIQEELWKKKFELRSLWINQNPDQAKVSALQKEIFDMIDQLQQESSNLRAEMVKVITPQQ
jgi:Spy/CpxP family protein refolding chaperone